MPVITNFIPVIFDRKGEANYTRTMQVLYSAAKGMIIVIDVKNHQYFQKPKYLSEVISAESEKTQS